MVLSGIGVSDFSSVYRLGGASEMRQTPVDAVCHKLYTALQQREWDQVVFVSTVDFSQIADDASKRIRACWGFRISVPSIPCRSRAYSGNFEVD
ncbi:hypothetical protein [Rhizobium sp. F40D2]